MLAPPLKLLGGPGPPLAPPVPTPMNYNSVLNVAIMNDRRHGRFLFDGQPCNVV